MVLFLIALELNPQKLWSLRVNIFVLGGRQVAGVMLIIGSGMGARGLSWLEAWIPGLGFALSSTVIAMQILRERNLSPVAVGQGAFSVLSLFRRACHFV